MKRDQVKIMNDIRLRAWPRRAAKPQRLVDANGATITMETRLTSAQARSLARALLSWADDNELRRR